MYLELDQYPTNNNTGNSSQTSCNILTNQNGPAGRSVFALPTHEPSYECSEYAGMINLLQCTNVNMCTWCCDSNIKVPHHWRCSVPKISSNMLLILGKVLFELQLNKISFTEKKAWWEHILISVEIIFYFQPRLSLYFLWAL